MTWWKVTTSGAGRASVLSASHKRRLADSPTSEGTPVFRTDSAPDSEVLGIADHGFGAQRPPLFEVLLDPGRFVITAQRGIDAFCQYPSPEWTRCRAVESPIKDQHDLIGPTYIEVIAKDPFKPHPASLRSVKHIGVGDLKLAEGQLVDIAGLPVRFSKRGGQPMQPAPEEFFTAPGPGRSQTFCKAAGSSQQRNPLSRAP